MTKFLEAFIDESCTQHRFLVLGGISCDSTAVAQCEARFNAVRQKHRLFGEVKWTKVSKSKLAVYKELIDVFFELSRGDTLHFHSLIADTSTFDNRTYNFGSREIGFNKLIYQLILKFGRLYGDNCRLYVYLDRRTTKASLIELRSIVNNGLAKRWDIQGWPVRRLDFRDSDSANLFQITDLLIGAIGHRKNGHDTVVGASPHKTEFVRHISNCAGLTDICRDTRLGATFSVWNYRFR